MAKTADEKPKPKQPFKTWAWGWIKSIAVAVAIWLTLRTFLIEAFRIPSGSMENTLLVGDFLFVTKALYGSEVPFTRIRVPAIREPRVGEVVVFHSVEGPFNVVKRLLGMPGDTMAMEHGHLVRNGVRLVEPYAIHTDSTRSESPEERRRMRTWQLRHYVGTDPAGYQPDVQDWGPLVVPRDSFMVFGDNRDNSVDSRYWGPVPRRNFRGKPLFIYYSYDASSWRSLPFLTAIRWKRLLNTPD